MLQELSRLIKHMNHMPIDPEVEFPKVQKMIYGLAWRTSQAYPISYDECLSEAYMAFMRACGDYQPKRGTKFSSWVYFWVWTKLKDLVMKRSKEPLEFVDINEELVGAAPPVQIESLELIDDLSSDAKEIISLLIETPRELLGMAMTPKQLMSKVKGHMIKKGRNPKQVEKAHKELCNRFQEAWA